MFETSPELINDERARLSTAALVALQKDSLAVKNSPLLIPEADSGHSVLLTGALSGLSQPVKALRQLAGSDSTHADKTKVPQNESTSRKVGEVVGSIVPYIAVGLITRGASARIFGETAAPSVYRVMGEQAATGLIMGSFLTSSELKPGESLFDARLKQGTVMAATFASMAGSANLLDRGLAPAAATSLIAVTGRRVLIGGVSGGIGGLVEAETRTGFKADKQDLMNSMLAYAAFGMLTEGGSSLARSYFSRNAGGNWKPDLDTSLELRTASGKRRIDGAGILAEDSKATIISSPAGWYDKLSNAIYKAPPDHTIVVTDAKWLEASKGILRSAKRADIKVVLDEAAAGKTANPGTQLASKAESVNPAKMDWAEKARLIDRLKEEIVKSGENPGEAITQALRKNRVVMVGEYHVQDSIHRELGAELMPQLKKSGLTHLAIEHSKDFKGKIFKPDGSLDKNSLPELLQHREFYRLLESAKKEGIEVVPVDGSFKASRELAFRNRVMDQEISSLLENPKNKVLFWVGNRHLQMLESGEGPQVAQLLRQRKIPVSTFYGQHDNFWREEPLRNMFTPDRALAVPTKQAPTLGKLNWLHPEQEGHKLHRFSEFDYVLTYPRQTPSHWD